jgi:alpha-beta hydrolase superfamily lysophospholipase
MPFDEQRALASPTGASLNLYMRRAEGTPRAVVQICHGLAEHAARYARFADFLSTRGFHTYAHDHRGHGFTKAPDAPQGMFGKPDGGAKVIADVAAVNALIAGEHPGLPIIVFGHSMGGLVATNFVLRHSASVHAAAIWNANFSAGFMGRVAQGILAWEKLRLGSDVPSRILPKLTFQAWGKKVPGHRTLFDWLSRDTDEVDKYVADPLCGWDASVSMWQDLFGFVFAGADDRNFSDVRRDLPINLVGGEKDPATDGGKSVGDLARRMKRMGFSNLVSTVYPETRHESLNEANRNIIMTAFADWAESVIRPH